MTTYELAYASRRILAQALTCNHFRCTKQASYLIEGKDMHGAPVVSPKCDSHARPYGPNGKTRIS